jgi:hypothetical protein
MDFFKGLTGAGSNPADPPASVLAEWNKYSTGDLESQVTVRQPGGKDSSVFSSVQQTLLNATNAASSSMYGAQSSASSSIRCVDASCIALIPSCIDDLRAAKLA